MKIISHKDYRLLPWKNGRGTTKEIQISPEGSSVSDGSFLWRMSSAAVTENGPFSEYPGYDRHLALIEGHSIYLHFMDPRKNILLNPGAVCRFSGDELVRGELLKGPITDLNLISRRDKIKADMKVMTFQRGPIALPFEETTNLIYVIAGVLVVESGNGSKITIQPSDTLELKLDFKLKPQLKLQTNSLCSFAWAEIGKI